MEKIKAANAIEALVKIELRGERVLTTKQLAEIYQTSEHNIIKNFRSNIERFEQDKHYFKLEGQELKNFKNLITNSDLVDKRTPSLILWTEKGASRHSKILDTDMAWKRFDELEETYFNVKYSKPKILSPTELLELQLKAIKENKAEIQEVKEDLQDFKVNIPLFGNEQYDLQKLVRSKGTSILGGRDSRAYKNKSLRQRLYADLQGEIKRQFGVNTYKAIKRSQLKAAKDIVSKYVPPLALKKEISSENYREVYGDCYEG